jgi:gamma-glutamyltranspeptidase/glutathione hydrolase
MAGVDVLQAGGSAVDAAIAADAMLSLVEPMSCGIGGDLFAILWSQKDRRLFGLNASGRSPYDWNLQQARDLGLKEIPLYHPLAWSVPGCVSGWASLHERFGKLSFSRLLEPAIQQAKEGFPVSPLIARSWSFGSLDTPAEWIEHLRRIRELQDELMRERGMAAMGGAPTSPGKIRKLRRSISRYLTITKEEEGEA